MRLLHAALGDLVLQSISQLLVSLIGLLHPPRHLIHVVGVLTRETFHKVAHCLVIRFEFLGQAVEFFAESPLFLRRELERIRGVLVEQLPAAFFRFSQQIAHSLHRALPILGCQTPAHEIPQRPADAFFFQQIVGEMFQEIVGGGKENLLCTIPLGVTVDSHYGATISQFGGESNPPISASKAPPVICCCDWTSAKVCRGG